MRQVHGSRSGSGLSPSPELALSPASHVMHWGDAEVSFGKLRECGIIRTDISMWITSHDPSLPIADVRHHPVTRQCGASSRLDREQWTWVVPSEGGKVNHHFKLLWLMGVD